MNKLTAQRPQLVNEILARRHLPALDGLRAVSIAMVFLYHYGGGKQSSSLLMRTFGNTINFGWIGVSLFFVLSGFLITGILWDSCGEKGWWGRFYIRRSLRIFPLYYFALLIAALLLHTAAVPPAHQTSSGLWIYAVYLQDFPSKAVIAMLQPLSSRVWLVHLWSLAVEEQFYLIWPMLLFAFARNRKAALRMIFVLWSISFLYRAAVVYLQLPTIWALNTLPGRSGELLAGACLALLVRGSSGERKRLKLAAPYVLCATFSSFVVLATYVVMTGMSQAQGDRIISTAGLTILSFAFPCLLMVAIENQTVAWWLSNAQLQWVGKISYGLYVYHFLFRRQFQDLADRIAPHASAGKHLLLVAFVALIGTFLSATASYYTLEIAFLKLKSTLGNRRAEVCSPKDEEDRILIAS